ncbi:glycosyltransferase [Alloiococcus sp. CFN-8]|uniref:glycosyltransferase n=1 Tax=Alloiococcus sp. CFN-8 TaxID=3416081 RepID=UPI003CEE73C3
MKKVLFLIHDLGQGGAEKVLVNLVNNMDTDKFDITVMTLFDVGVNRKFLNNRIKYRTVFGKMLPGNSHMMKLRSPRYLHKTFIKERYDIEVAYLEGPSARIISGCSDPNTKLVCWIHCTIGSPKALASSFRSMREAEKCYKNFDTIAFVSDGIRESFLKQLPDIKKTIVLYNTNNTNEILYLKDEPVEDGVFYKNEIRICGVGKLVPLKGFDKLAHIHKRLRDEGYPIHTYIMGMGPEREKLESYIYKYHLEDNLTLLGYQTNPYKFVSRCDLFVCSSFAEGFSTATTESLIVGTPVMTTPVSGMKEMLGDSNEYGVIVDNYDEALYMGIKNLLDNPELLKHYKGKAEERGKDFCTQRTVKAVEDMLTSL